MVYLWQQHLDRDPENRALIIVEKVIPATNIAGNQNMPLPTGNCVNALSLHELSLQTATIELVNPSGITWIWWLVILWIQ